MTAKKKAVSDELLGRLATKQAEIFRRVKSGVLDSGGVLDLLQRAIDGRGDIRSLPFPDETVDSRKEYPQEHVTQSVENQLAIWREHFPDLDEGHVLRLAQRSLPSVAEGWCVIPKPSKIIDPEDDEESQRDSFWEDEGLEYGKLYCLAVARILDVIVERGIVETSLAEDIDTTHLKLSSALECLIIELEEKTPGDFIVIAFQFGRRWRGVSVRSALMQLDRDEFALGLYEVLALLVIHPQRITAIDQLNVDIGGCNFFQNTAVSYLRSSRLEKSPSSLCLCWDEEGNGIDEDSGQKLYLFGHELYCNSDSRALVTAFWTPLK